VTPYRTERPALQLAPACVHPASPRAQHGRQTLRNPAAVNVAILSSMIAALGQELTLAINAWESAAA